MKIVIDIPEGIYESCKKECNENDSLIIDTFTYAIGNGTPLPKEYGRLGDLDTLEALIKDEILKHDLNEYGCLHLVKHTPTIIEANIENEG